MSWRDQFQAALFWLLIGLAVVLFAGSLCCGAELFQWAEPAEHHAAAVVIRAGSAGGSGVYVRLSESVVGVLTCQHVVSGNAEARVQWSTGEWTSGAVLSDRTQADAAYVVIEAQHATIQPLTVAANPPQQGERVEYLGFGGPAGRTLRPHWGTVLGYSGQDMRSTNPVVSGDSGGCVLNEAHEVVGLSAYGVNTVALVAGPDGQRWNVYQPSGGPAQPTLAAFCGRVLTRMQCGPGGCPSPYSYQQPGRGGGGGSLYPPTPFQKPEAPPPQPPLKPPQMVEIDYAKLLDLAAKDGRFKGPAGKDGVDGAQGPAGASIPGAAGPPGPAGPPPSADEIKAAVAQWIRDNPGEVAAIVSPHLPGIWFRKVDATTGNEMSAPEEVKLSEGFTFYLHPNK